MRVELIAFTARGNALAERLAAELTGAGCPAACTREGLRVEEWAARAFGRSEALVFVGAAGIAVRAIAPCLRHKSTDPAVVVVDEAMDLRVTHMQKVVAVVAVGTQTPHIMSPLIKEKY